MENNGMNGSQISSGQQKQSSQKYVFMVPKTDKQHELLSILTIMARQSRPIADEANLLQRYGPVAAVYLSRHSTGTAAQNKHSERSIVSEN